MWKVKDMRVGDFIQTQIVRDKMIVSGVIKELYPQFGYVRLDSGQECHESDDLLYHISPGPLFKNVSCSSCGALFGPGNHGFSHCDGHAGLEAVD